jgi:hypothetical protein
MEVALIPIVHANHVILTCAPRVLSSDGIQTAEVRLDARSAQDPEETSKQIVRALKDPVSLGDEPLIHRF